MNYCTNCGKQLNDGAKFCANCGTPVSQNTSNTERKTVFDGEIHKCPSCGAIITQTTMICPDCGLRITGRSALSSVQAFKNQLMQIESTRKPRKNGVFGTVDLNVDPADSAKLSLIRSFPVPNTIDDVLEFLVLAVANIEVGLSKNTFLNRWYASAKSESSLTIGKTISDAWVSKMQQVYQKAKLMFANDPLFIEVQNIYASKMKELKIKVL